MRNDSWASPGRWRGPLLRGLAGLLALGVALMGCGGGVGGEGTGSAETLASGPISGFGSIVVNGVHYNVDSAGFDDLGGGGRNSANLQLGMVVEVAAGVIDSSSGTPRAVASTVRVAPELLGPVEGLILVDSHTASLLVMGFTVRVDATTNLDAYPNGLSAAVLTDKVVEVFGYYDVQRSEYVATRLQPRSGPVTRFLVRGPVSGFDPAGSFHINGQKFTFSPGAVPAGVANGSFSRLEVQAARDPVSGNWPVLGSSAGGPSRSDANEAELKGRVTDISTTAAGMFSVNGVRVDASVIGLPAGLVLGARVEVEGALRSGTLVARRVQLESEDDARGLEFEGTLINLDTTQRSFQLRGERGIFPGLFSYSETTVVEPAGASVAGLAGRKVEVKGRLSADRSRVEVSRLHAED